MTGDEKLAEDVKRNFEEANLDEKTKKMLRFVCRANHKATDIRKADLDALREAGFSDRAILEIAIVTGMFQYFNVVADVLGIDLEEEMPPKPDA